ncbi:heat-inducible transcriptional repressor HrcA [Fictibacillus sp. Mic-4]|uniref:heat-inducible transcriptional repressor HrcA n=1 Tax=Fictibacillus TaxID=1329200 RepID=UPI000424733E|nr:heat-inducible transcriptional repressor HrcA [Fictibacillus gelatini]
MLSERQLYILQVLIDDYIQHVEPIGSRTISKRDDIPYSPATIRNELADLEEMGFLEKPHTSSGRIPSEKGYRFYVDHLLPPPALSPVDVQKMRLLFNKKVEDTEKIFEQSAKILSEMTNYTSIILGPEALETTLKHMQIIPLTTHSAVAIFVTSTGHVENRQFTLPEGIELNEIEKLVNILNERLSGVPLSELSSKIHHELAVVFKNHLTNYEKIGKVLDGIMKWGKKDKIFYGGKTKILSQPEFRDVDKVKSLLEALEEKTIVERLISSDTDGVIVTIGHENKIEAIQNCSIIKASYSVGGNHVGSISLIGPTRMEYKRVISLIDTLANEFSKAFSDQYN